jgi:hypothetical protein
MRHVGDQAHRLVQLAQSPCVHGVALHQMLAQHVGSPDAELGATLGFNPVTDRDNDVEVVEGNGPVGTGNVQNLHIAFFVQFAFLEHVVHMLGQDRTLPPE